MLLGVLLVLILAWPLLQGREDLFQDSANRSGSGGSGNGARPISAAGLAGRTATLTPTRKPATQTPTEELIISPTPEAILDGTAEAIEAAQGVWILAMHEGRAIHLFAYHPASQPLIRLTAGDWQDITPSVSPNGSTVAFSSNREGHWDLYLLDLTTGETSQLTNTPEYESGPTWSPDGLWLAYETYRDGDLEIYIRPVAGDQEEIRLTEHPGADFSPAWSPVGRQIAFVSDRTGENEVWIANLDQPGEGQFLNLSQDPLSEDTHPAWSPAGSELAWTSGRGGLKQIKFKSTDSEAGESIWVGSGDWPVWSPDGFEVLSRMPTPNQTFLVSYKADPPGMVSAPAGLSFSPLEGLDWGPVRLMDPLPPLLRDPASAEQSPLYQLALDVSNNLGERRGLVDLEGIEAPYPQLHDLVDESYVSLRLSASYLIGWDLLSSLENAFVPLTSPQPPGLSEDWLLTGRAFAVITSPLEAGWMAVVKEDFGQDVYWRVFVKARYQDGSQGLPMQIRPWIFNTQNNTEINLYEHGGRLASTMPEGYWVDLTDLAAAYGWERLPALYNWKSYFLGTRLNEFVMREGLDWRSAMLELYPPEALITPTVIVPPTRTPTATVRWWRTPTPSSTPLPPPTLTPSPSP
jgi:TolB protein